MARVQHRQENRPVLNPTEARQGRRGGRALMILVISMALIGLIYAVMVIGVQGSRLTDRGGQTLVDRKTLQQSQGFQAPPSQPRQSENPQTTPSLTPGAGK